MKACDRLCLVTYDTNVYVNFKLTAMDQINKEKTRGIIQSLHVGSSTNISGGLMEGTCTCVNFSQKQTAVHY